MILAPDRVRRRLMSNVTHTDDGCIVSNCSVGSHGYSQIGWQVKDERFMVLGHRLSWEIHNGEIPQGMTIDHICRNRPCINPKHLRLLSNIDNATDNGQGRKTHCPRGHEYSGENLYIAPQGHRRCRECARITRRLRKL